MRCDILTLFPDMVAPVRQLLGEVTATVAAGSGP